MLKKFIACIAILSMAYHIEAKVTITNRTDIPIKVAVYADIVGRLDSDEIKPSETKTITGDVAYIKRGYEVWIKENLAYRKVISLHKIADAGAFRKLDVLQHKDPETGEILYSIYRSGY